MFDWTIYPDSTIAKLPSPILQKMALLVRNLRALILRNSFSAKYTSKYALKGKLIYENPGSTKLGDTRVFEELELGVEYVLGAAVVGDIAEFGTHGRTASVICKKLAAFRSKRPVHLFDSFQGFPRVTTSADVDSPHVRSGAWPEGGSKGPLSPGQLRELLEQYLPPGQIRIYAGWFKDTLPDIPEKTAFAMVHIDCDLYEPTYEVLAFLFQHKIISEGCIIFFDDWNCNRALPYYGERKAWNDIVARFNINFSDGGDYGWGGHRFHVHAYR
jgi:hypothetical protein